MAKIFRRSCVTDFAAVSKRITRFTISASVARKICEATLNHDLHQPLGAVSSGRVEMLYDLALNRN